MCSHDAFVLSLQYNTNVPEVVQFAGTEEVMLYSIRLDVDNLPALAIYKYL